MNAAISETLIEMTVKPIWRALSIAARSGVPVFQIAERVLDHHDRVIDNEADRDRERHQG